MDRSTEQLRDEWLALRCQAGDAGAFAELVERFEPGLLYYATKLLGSDSSGVDVLQDVWIRAFRTIRKLRHPGAVRAWLYRMVHGACVDSVRRGAARRRAESAVAEMAQTVDDDSDEAFDADDAAMIHAALDHLSESHREVLMLFFLEEFSTSEIASIVEVPEGTVKSRLHHAKRAMRVILETKLA